ncbi:Protein BRANCHLESS TRICHOME [Camellia lanceoleosa]|nr:Protein BRANCHLESS TRICHOME [Camellia lanceoleosa]
MESMNTRLARELSRDRKGREALERVREELANEISSHKAEINRMKKDMQEERKMLRMVEVIREERVQMKLTDAKLFLEEKILEFEETKQIQKPDTNNGRTIATHTNSKSADSFLAESIRSCAIAGEKSSSFNVENNINNGIANPMSIQRKASPERQNPHIKRGIKGFVEFPKVVQAIGSKKSSSSSASYSSKVAEFR